MRLAHQLSILIVDDHLLVRQGLRQVLSQEYRDVFFGDEGTAEGALAQIKAHPWHLVILDVSLPDGDGFSVLQETRAHRPDATVLMLSVDADSADASRALQLGAAGYISKSANRSDLLKAVKNVLDGKRHFSESTRQEADTPRSAALRANLSAQECRVLLALAAGRRNGEIAAELNLSGKTVSTYKRRLLDKLGLKSTADLIRYAGDHKLSRSSWPT